MCVCVYMNVKGRHTLEKYRRESERRRKGGLALAMHAMRCSSSFTREKVEGTRESICRILIDHLIEVLVSVSGRRK